MGAGSLLLALALAAFAAKPFPEPPRDYVHNEGVVSAAAEARLSARLSAFEKETGHQFVVALFGSLEGESLEDYSNRLFKHWRIGDAKRDDGVLLALFKGDRRWRVEVGYGLESELTDLEAGLFMNDYAVPRFKEGDFDGGLEAAVGALAERLSGRTPKSTFSLKRETRNLAWELWQGLVLGLLAPLAGFLFFVMIVMVVIAAFRRPGVGGGSSWESDSSWSSGSDWSGGGSSDSGGGFSGGGGDSGGGGASGGW